MLTAHLSKIRWNQMKYLVEFQFQLYPSSMGRHGQWECGHRAASRRGQHSSTSKRSNWRRREGLPHVKGCKVNSYNFLGPTTLLLADFENPTVVEALLNVRAKIEIKNSRTGRAPGCFGAHQIRWLWYWIKLILEAIPNIKTRFSIFCLDSARDLKIKGKTTIFVIY